MRTYVIREGSRYVVEQDTLTRLLVTSAIADQDMHFMSSELFEVDALTKSMTFRVGNRWYRVNRDNVTVLD